tara:strand:+ start:3733 stop:4068 length:336 start_codon:yes stop_codon:yes gene_type:complete
VVEIEVVGDDGIFVGEGDVGDLCLVDSPGLVAVDVFDVVSSSVMSLSAHSVSSCIAEAKPPFGSLAARSALCFTNRKAPSGMPGFRGHAMGARDTSQLRLGALLDIGPTKL